jgi:hypothetical protein
VRSLRPTKKGFHGGQSCWSDGFRVTAGTSSYTKAPAKLLDHATSEAAAISASGRKRRQSENLFAVGFGTMKFEHDRP